MSLSSAELTSRYRNLLIAMAREHVAIGEAEQAMRAGAVAAKTHGSFAGRNCKANTLRGQRCRLAKLLRRNRAALLHYFATDDVEDVASMRIEL